MCCRYWAEREDIADISELASSRSFSAGLKTGGDMHPGDLLPLLANDRRRRLSAFPMRWGYTLGKKLLINARSETALQKDIFREGMAQHRCAAPASGYYEWDAEKRKYRISSGKLLYLAGIYRMESSVPVFTILTRAPFSCVSGIHDRMPVVLDRSGMENWLDLSADGEEALLSAVSSLSCVPV